MSEQSNQPTTTETIHLRLSREEAQALLLAVDSLNPMLDRLREEIARPAVAESNGALDTVRPAPVYDDALARVGRLARQSLEEARRFAVGERRITPEQRKAWQEAARRYAQEARKTVAAARSRSDR
jgi:hypothetical protein